VGRRLHDQDLGLDPARVRLEPVQAPADEVQVPLRLRQGLRDLRVAALALGLGELVDEQATPETTPFRSPVLGSSSIWSSSSNASRWALTRVLFRNDCSRKMAVVRLTLA
jgi:hypothetical protein